MNTGCTLILDAFWVDNTPFPTVQQENSDNGRIFHKYYDGDAPCLGWMDLCLLKQIIKVHNITHIILQNLEAFGKICAAIGGVKVCTSYKHNQIISSRVPSQKDLVNCKPLYHTVEVGGWEFSENGELPYRVQTYIYYLLFQTRVNSITCFTNKFTVTASFDMNNRIVFNYELNS